MKTGKVSESILKRSVFKQIKHRRDEVLVGPGVGKDCAMIHQDDEHVMILSTDPITGSVKDIGKLAVYVTSNDIASGGGEMIGIMVTLLLPEKTSEKYLKEIIHEMEMTCASLNIEIIGGHSEVTKAVNQPIISVTGIGKLKKSEINVSSGLIPGQDVVMTKWAGLEGSAIIASEKEEELLTRYTKDFIQGAKDMLSSISIVKEAQIAKDYDVTLMHDITEGGVFGALWEVAALSDVGIEVDLKKIPIRQETIEICEFFDLNPYQLMSSGCLLLATNRGSDLVEALKAEHIPAAIIGKVTSGNERIVFNEDERRFLSPAKSDELYKVM